MRHLISAILSLSLLTQCGLTHSVDRNSPDWNKLGLWQKVPGGQNDYMPRGFHGKPLGGAAGQWVCDPQDGTRFYVPAGGTREYSEGTLRAEATKATNRYTMEVQRTRNALTWAFAPVNIPVAWWRNMGPAEGGASPSDFDTDTSTDNSQTECRKESHKNCSHEHKDCKNSNSKH